ncbi:SRPBCC family protein [Streptomyces sp. NE06-03E]|uniref:SRPBCC family protein n=1 Tax=Streptomyces sp. NE06-03E TaxID=3028695 RepID=UPI0029B0E996|nr:SRPBCC family protein [Streptomyces sp. NE06-03E]MDX3058217.1 SRPBCC family protein [Streptomyces sp. NE06-03E]
MLYADGPSTHREIRISAGAARVWEVLADVGAMAGWSPELVEVEWQDGATYPVPGARCTGRPPPTRCRAPGTSGTTNTP